MAFLGYDFCIWSLNALRKRPATLRIGKLVFGAHLLRPGATNGQRPSAKQMARERISFDLGWNERTGLVE